MLLLLAFLFSCTERHDPYPPKNMTLYIEDLKFYKGFIYINDTLSFTGVYFKYTDSLKLNKDIELYNCIKYYDTLITDNNPDKYVIIRRNGEDEIFYKTFRSKKIK